MLAEPAVGTTLMGNASCEGTRSREGESGTTFHDTDLRAVIVEQLSRCVIGLFHLNSPRFPFTSDRDPAPQSPASATRDAVVAIKGGSRHPVWIHGRSLCHYNVPNARFQSGPPRSQPWTAQRIGLQRTWDAQRTGCPERLPPTAFCWDRCVAQMADWEVGLRMNLWIVESP